MRSGPDKRLFSLGSTGSGSAWSVGLKRAPRQDTASVDLAIAEEPRVLAAEEELRLPRESGKLVPLQTWEGYVTEVAADAIVARLTDLTGREPDLEVEIARDEIPRSDISLIRPGAVFYWHISYVDHPNGQRTRTSEIRFRRLPTWRADELAAAEAESERRGRILGWD